MEKGGAKKVFTIVVTLLLLIGLIAVTSSIVFNQEKQKQFYVGVTYCGNSVQEAKKLVDQVKNYTNLFVLQSGLLQGDTAAMDEIGDYVVASNLNYAVHGSIRDDVGLNNQLLHRWLICAKEKWGGRFIGIYYGDEPGGKMLDGSVTLENQVSQIGGTSQITPKIIKEEDGTIINQDNETITIYRPDGTINFRTFSDFSQVSVDYHPNGTFDVYEFDFNTGGNTFYNSKNITKCPLTIQPYEEILKQKPIQTHDDAAIAFVNVNKNNLERINKTQLQEKSILVFTADYGLYWWDYQSGYDVILAELGWNHTTAQDIGLVRGAANIQNKSWGTIITWKYTHPPFLTDGKEMFEQMKTSYQAGAQYVIIFNYSEDREKPNTLQEEHFQALEHFWNDVVQNSRVKHGNIKAEAALVLPQNYGWGMRHPNDKIWDIWPADDTSQTIWNQLQNKLDTHGLKIDIVYEDPNHPVAGRYNNVYYWNGK